MTRKESPEATIARLRAELAALAAQATPAAAPVKRKIGRPARSGSASYNFQLRLTDEERARWEHQAEEEGHRTLSDFLRAAADARCAQRRARGA